MKQSSTSTLSLFFLAALFVAAFYRVVRMVWAPDVLPNFSPVMAVAFCGAVFLPWGALASAVAPIVALAISDAILNTLYGQPMFNGVSVILLACYAGAGLFGWALRGWKENFGMVLGAAAVNSVAFYLITNTVEWLGNSAYAKSGAGWVQALTVGVPGYAPTWVFFRNSFVSDLLFTACFAIAALAASRAVSARSDHAAA